MLILVWQALRGESIVAPDAPTLAALGATFTAALGATFAAAATAAATVTLRARRAGGS